MIIAILLLWSLVGVSLTRFFYNKRLKVAATAYGVLYISLVAWMFFMYFMDAAHLQLGIAQWSLWDASDIYEAFITLYHQLYAISADWLIAVVFLCITFALSVGIYLVVSSVQIAKDLYLRLRRTAPRAPRMVYRAIVPQAPVVQRRIYLTYCRLNS